MKHIKTQQELNETSENLNISDVSHSLWGEIKIGDTIEWSGDYFDGYNVDRTYKLKHLEGG